MAQLFGWEIKRRSEPDSQKSFVPEIKDDGAVIVAAGGAYGTFIDLEGTVRTEAELVTKYRQMAQQPEIDRAVNEIVNEAIVSEDGKDTVEIVLDDLPVQDPKIKQVIEQEFKEILRILDFNKTAYDIFKRWYIDGRHYWHAVIDEKAPALGIQDLRYIDPRKIRKIREVNRKKDMKTDATVQTTKTEYYIYAERGLDYGSNKITANLGTSGIKITKDAIIQITSGLTDVNNSMSLSYLHPAIKHLNQLRSLEDATLIYHLSRAPERRIFNVEVGALPKMKAEQFVKEQMNNYKNKLSYDARTGEIKDDRKFMHINEDFWFPTREGKGTRVDVLAGGAALPDLLQSVEYFQDRLYRALQVPLTRLKNDNAYTLGRATEISRDEVNFSKFIDRIRNKFSELFIFALERQLILKKITTPDDWDYLKDYIQFRYLRDNFFTELKDMEILNERMDILAKVKDYTAGAYYSHRWIRRNILKQTEEEIEENDAEIAKEINMIQYHPEILQAQLQANIEPEPQKGPSSKNKRK